MSGSAESVTPAAADGDAARSDRPVLAFLGTGLMGRPMIERLLSAGFIVHVWNRSRDKLAPLLERGALALDAPRQAAERADLVLACLMDSSALEMVLFGEQGRASVAPDAARARFFVDHSSVDPRATQAMSARLMERLPIDWVDAPVSGGVGGASAGTLAVMCGGSPEAVARVTPVIRSYAGNVTRMGPVGAGQATKLVNQVIVGSTIATLAEAVALAQAGGIDAAMLPRALAGGWADSRPMQVFVPRMVDGWAQPIGAASTMLKDLDTAADFARRHDAPLPMTAQAIQLYRMLMAAGRGDDDPAALVDLVRPPRHD